MNDFDAVMIAEEVHDASEKEYIAAWQHLIDTGVCWNLQGWFGRTAITMIEEGICIPAEDNNVI